MSLDVSLTIFPLERRVMLQVCVILRARLFSWNREKTMVMKRFTRPFHQLRGKLTLSYTLTSVVTFLVVELLFIAAILTVVALNIQTIAASNFKREASQIAPYFVHGLPDSEELTAALRVIDANVSVQTYSNWFRAFYASSSEL